MIKNRSDYSEALKKNEIVLRIEKYEHWDPRNIQCPICKSVEKYPVLYNFYNADGDHFSDNFLYNIDPSESFSPGTIELE